MYMYVCHNKIKLKSMLRLEAQVPGNNSPIRFVDLACSYTFSADRR